jgi:hypothetical protein
MAERVPRPTDAANCNWASDGVTYPPSDPGAPKRATGFKPIDIPIPGAGGIIPANDFNYVLKLTMEMISWARDFITREWADLAEGIAETTVSQLFRVYPPTTGMRVRGSQLWLVAGTATGGGTIYHICTDGEQIYYIAGASSEYVVVAKQLDGSEIAEAAAPGGDSFTALCCDGGFLYATTDAVATAGIRRLSRVDGTADTNVGSEYACSKLRANGYYAAGISPNSGNGKVVVWSDIQTGSIAEDGVYASDSANLVALAVDHENAYVGGVRGAPSTYDVWMIKLSDRTLIYGKTLPTTTAPAVSAIDTDGDLVFVATDRVTLSAGGSANLFILDRVLGSLVATADVPSLAGAAADLINVVVDDQYIYCFEDTGHDCAVLKKPQIDTGNSNNAFVAYIDDLWIHAADGVSVIGVTYADQTKMARHWIAGPTKTFMKADSGDVTRRPFYTLAVPTDSRI